MKVCLFHNHILPISKYGGRERGVWWLAKELNSRGHKVTLIAPQGTIFPFGEYFPFDTRKTYNEQIPDEVDIVHVHYPIQEEITKKPVVFTNGGNGHLGEEFHKNTIFLSKNHAERHGANAFVHNGIDPEDYGDPGIRAKKHYVHFLAKAAWRLKNVKGAIHIAQGAKIPLEVIGGKRLNIKMGFRLTLDPRMHFHGFQGGEYKNRILRHSKALLFPVLWHEPFGMAIVESLYFGCPVFGTPWGSLKELINEEIGFLSDSYSEHIERLKNMDTFNHKRIHEYLMACHTSKNMTDGYISYYEKVLSGEKINQQKPKVKAVQPRGFFKMH